MKSATKKKHPIDIYETLRGMINELEIIPGSRITEMQLAEYFNVSRTPVRAALQKLENEDLLTIKPKQGCFIRNIDLKKISQYYDVRVTLENMVLTEVSKNMNSKKLEILSSNWDPETCKYGDQVTSKLKQAEESFHLELANLSENSVLEGFIEDINQKIRCVRLQGWPDKKSVIDTYSEHHRICQLLLSGDLSTAQAEMTVHIRKSQAQANKLTLHQLFNKSNLIQFE